MVMEAPPSPQCVGREFVRQYYTLLNQAPSHLHRFYNNNSSFVHGGLDAPNRETNPVVGQKQIHQKIQQLNFRDCHAKISQVDSQATLGNGIVVQVTGELSNSGQPMRRFTQTFVLAAQSPKKYYVHNDIFRYQDMLGDDELEHESARSDVDDENHDQHEQTHSDTISPQTPQLPQQMAYYNNTSALATQTTIVPAQTVTPAPPTVQPTTNAVLQAPPPLPIINGTSHSDEVLQTQIGAPQQPNNSPAAVIPAPHLLPQPTPGANAGIQTPQVTPTAPATVAHVNVLQQPPQPTQVPIQPQSALNSNPPIAPQAPVTTVPQPPTETLPTEPDAVPQEQEEVEVADEETREIQIKQEEDIQPEPVTANEPKTYATSVKSGASTTSNVHASTTKPTTTSPPPTMRPLEQRESSSSSTGNVSSGFGIGQGGRGSGGPRRGGPNIRGMARNDRPGPIRSLYNNEENGLSGSNANDGDRRRPNSFQFNDNHQLFLGNIPSFVAEDELKKFFSQYGSVIDIRIHNKPNKNLAGARVPNYGFIIFESVEAANNVLKEKPIYFPTPNGDIKLNVEEKKTRSRPMDGSRISDGGNSLPGRNGGGGNNTNGSGPGNGSGNSGNRGNNGQSGNSGNMMMRGSGSGGGMPRGGARGFGGGRGEGRGGGNMSRGTNYRRN